MRARRAEVAQAIQATTLVGAVLLLGACGKRSQTETAAGSGGDAGTTGGSTGAAEPGATRPRA